MSLVAVTRKYASLLESLGAVPEQADLQQKLQLPADRHLLLNHARWQMEVARRVLDKPGGLNTAIRLLGAAQGILVATGVISIGETWADNDLWMDRVSARAFESAVSELQSLNR